MDEPSTVAKPLRRFLRLQTVEAITGLRKSSIYKRISERSFPRPVPLGEAPNSPVGWIEDEIAAWQAARIQMRAEKVAP